MTKKAYIEPEEIIKGAQEAGLSVGNYIEKYYSYGSTKCPDSAEGGPGYTESVTNWLLENASIKLSANYLEIGTGTGRYFDALQMQRPAIKCESYEAHDGWAAWLDYTYRDIGLIRRHVDGYSLRETENKSIDLCSAHGVFIYLDTLVTFNYLKEMSRCLRPGGYLYFDILDFDRPDIVTVLDRCMPKHHYLIPISKRAVVAFLQRFGIHMIAERRMTEGLDISTYLLLKKKN